VDAARTVIPSRTYVYLADVGTTAPTDVTTVLAAAWVNVGNTTPDSLNFKTEPQFDSIPSAQSDYPIRRFQTSEDANIQVDLLEWSDTSFQGVYGGGTVTETGVGSGVFKFVPPKIGERAEKAAIIEVIDGTKHYRYIFPRVMQTEGVEQALGKAKEAILPLRMSVQGGDAVDAWYLLTDDPAFDPTTP
jgi:hypothetical protein